MKPRYRLLAVDLDGTLLDSGKEIPARNREALLDAHDAGVAIAIASGRRFPGLRKLVVGLGLDPYVFANSGAIIRKGLDGKILRRRFLPLEVASRVLRAAETCSLEPVVHDGPSAEGYLILRISARDHPPMQRYLNRTFPAPMWVETIRLEREPVQIGFTGTVASMRRFEAHLRRTLDDLDGRFDVARTEYLAEDLGLLDVLAADACKANALRFLARELGVGSEETMAIGDNWNDLGMLEEAGLGVIMANAVPELKRRGFAETSSNDEAGVAEAIRKYLLPDPRSSLRGSPAPRLE